MPEIDELMKVKKISYVIDNNIFFITLYEWPQEIKEIL